MSDIFDRPGQMQGAAEPPARSAATRKRFETCRWRTTQDSGGAPYCTHRDVLPYAGRNGFNPEAWCPDCAFFKVRRAPRKRPDYLSDDF